MKHLTNVTVQQVTQLVHVVDMLAEINSKSPAIPEVADRVAAQQIKIMDIVAALLTTEIEIQDKKPR